MALQPFVGHWLLILYTISRTPWIVDQPVARPLPTCITAQAQNKSTLYRHPCFQLDSNPRSQCSSERSAGYPYETVIRSAINTELTDSLRPHIEYDGVRWHYAILFESD
jgi:hypothetical protein